MAITLTHDARKQAVASIRRYLSETWEQDVGDLKAGLLLDYFLKEIGPSVYNRAIDDAQVYFRDRVVDLEGTCFEKEFGFWPAASQRGRR
jgi:uncharacterized protein (DUF2164 family)